MAALDARRVASFILMRPKITADEAAEFRLVDRIVADMVDEKRPYRCPTTVPLRLISETDKINVRASGNQPNFLARSLINGTKVRLSLQVGTRDDKMMRIFALLLE